MSKLIILPIENIESRYTIMMNQVLKQYADIWVYPENWTDSKIDNGEFLDIIKTSNFKSKQLGMVAELFQNGLIQDGDVFFISDIFFPGIESIKYMSELLGIDVKVYGINHAGRADKFDFIQKLGDWADVSEYGYHKIADGIFVGSQFHKNNIVNKFDYPYDNIYVTGMIWSLDYMNQFQRSGIKKDYIIWPHRVSDEKGINDLLEISTRINKPIYITSGNLIDSDFKEMVNLGYKNIKIFDNLSKSEYYELFDQAKCYLSTSKQETFGYTIQEAIFFGCSIFVPLGNASEEMVPYNCTYQSYQDLIDRINSNQLNIPSMLYTSRWEKSINTMLRVMGFDK